MTENIISLAEKELVQKTEDWLVENSPPHPANAKLLTSRHYEYYGETSKKMRQWLVLFAYEECRVKDCKKLGSFVPYPLEHCGGGHSINHGPDQECLFLCTEHRWQDSEAAGGLYTSGWADSVLYRPVRQPKWVEQPEWEE